MTGGDREERIRKRAHAIWQSEGEAHGAHERHWQQATTDIDEEDRLAAASQPGGRPSPDASALGAGPALAEHSKDAKAPGGTRKPAAPRKAPAPKKPAAPRKKV